MLSALLWIYKAELSESGKEVCVTCATASSSSAHWLCSATPTAACFTPGEAPARLLLQALHPSGWHLQVLILFH